MYRWDIINSLIKKNDYKSYLEVGVQDPNSNFNKIRISNKISIDPFPRGFATFVGTSDAYFDFIKDSDIKFDIVFIDGLHHDDQVLKDIENSLNHLNEKGIIVCHDCLPRNEREQQRNDHGGPWMGDVWKAIAKLRMTRNDLKIQVVDTDCGCGLITKEQSELYNFDVGNIEWRTYDFYAKNKLELMNVITVEEFKKNI